MSFLLHSRALGILFVALLLLGCRGSATRPDPTPAAPSEPAVAIAQDVPAVAVATVLPTVVPDPLLPWAAPPRARNDGIAAPPAIGALAAVVIDEASGEVLFDKDAHVPLPPASLTKIATLVLALESGRLDEWVDIDVDSREMPRSTVMGLIPGDRFTLRDLLYGLMLPSGNDAALAIGRFLAGSDAAFVQEMNRLLLRQGLRESQFSNPHGLGSPDHVTSAYDLAMLSRYGMSLPGFREIVTTGGWTAQGSRVLPLTNINSFLYSYPGADGLKTGYTRRSGQTLAASATRNGHRLYAIILNSLTRDADAINLLNWAFANLVWDR